MIRNGEKYFTSSIGVETAFDPFKNTFVTMTYFYSISFEETSSSPKDLEALYAQSEERSVNVAR